MSKVIKRRVKVINHELPEYIGLVGKVDKVEDPSVCTFPIRVMFDSGKKEIFKEYELRYLNNRKVVI